MDHHRLPPLRSTLGRILSSRWAPPVLIAVAACAAYLPAVAASYAFSDDYRHFGSAHGVGGSVWRVEAGGGRPIQGAQLAGVLALVPDLDSLRYVRLLGLVGVALLGILLYHVLRSRDVGRWLATGIAVSVITLPSSQVYVSWAVLWAAPFAAILAGVASLRIASAPDDWSRRAVRRYAEAATILLCGLLTYQPAAMFFWVFTAVEILRPGVRLDRAARTLATRLGVAAVAMAGGLVATRLGVHFYGGVYAGRTELVRDLTGKVEWFWREPLVNAFNVFELVPSKTLAVAVALVAAAGIALLHAETGWKSLGFLGLAAALVPLSYSPNLAVSENWATYRSLGGLSALAMLYLWLGLWGIARATPRLAAGAAAARCTAVALALLLGFVFVALVAVPLSHLTRSAAAQATALDDLGGWRHLTAVLLAVAIVCAVGALAARGAARVAAAAGALAVAALALTAVLLAARNVTTLFAEPQSLELRMVRAALDRPTTAPIRRVVFVKPFFRRGAAPLVRYDEFGVPSSYLPWVPVPAVLLTLQERRNQAIRPAIDVLAWDAPTIPRTTRPGEVLVDMRKLRQRRIGWRVWTLHASPADG